jgi:hypothetical protein
MDGSRPRGVAGSVHRCRSDWVLYEETRSQGLCGWSSLRHLWNAPWSGSRSARLEVGFGRERGWIDPVRGYPGKTPRLVSCCPRWTADEIAHVLPQGAALREVRAMARAADLPTHRSPRAASGPPRRPPGAPDQERPSKWAVDAFPGLAAVWRRASGAPRRAAPDPLEPVPPPSLRALGALAGPGVPRRCGRRGRRLSHLGIRGGRDAPPLERREGRLRLHAHRCPRDPGRHTPHAGGIGSVNAGGHPSVHGGWRLGRAREPGPRVPILVPERLGHRRVFRGGYGALRYGRSGGDRVPPSPTGSPHDGVGAAARTGHRAVQWLRDARDEDSTNRARVPIDIRWGDGARCGRHLDPIGRHHHQGARREPRDRGSVPRE